ncbi:Protein of unknown function [Raineyella antarctica]|uniref:DUF3515 domain-containing protein n=1 Tax=Raineyella antarctica TaxID=1577474 RepID=A0A1G6GQV3_9ACTN|nr:DUF3515 domain-containing protein [Raineyella antarctica]SDB84422.1 Protein of unknown function [Raineyella antarctica]
MRALRLLAGAGVMVLLAGCAAPVTLPDPVVDAPTRDLCTSLVAATPESVLGSPRRETTGTLGAAWGDPPITLECGIPQPPGLTATSQCLEVDGVGWWPQDGVTGQVFTTIGRRTHVRIGVPNSYGNTGDVLAQLSPVVAEHIPQVRPCAG